MLVKISSIILASLQVQVNVDAILDVLTGFDLEGSKLLHGPVSSSSSTVGNGICQCDKFGAGARPT